MTVFKYSGRTSTGAMKKGTVDAENQNAAVAKLRKQGINPREIAESKSLLHKELSLGGKVKNEDFVVYCRQFATLIRAGISLVESTNILAEQSTSKTLKKHYSLSRKIFVQEQLSQVQQRKIAKCFRQCLSI